MENKFSWLPSNEEGIIQTRLILLSSYTDTPLRQEVLVDNNGHRIDLMLGDYIAIELRTKLITPVHIKAIIFEKNYYHALKQKYPNFQTLILCSNVGITPEAEYMVNPCNPHIVYETVAELANRFITKVNSAKLGVGVARRRHRFKNLLSV